MRSKYSAISVLPLIIFTVCTVGWSQDGLNRVIDSRIGENVQRAVPDEPFSSSDVRSGDQSELARPSGVSIPIIPFIIEYWQGNLHFRQPIDDNPDYIKIHAQMQNGPSPIYQVTLTEKAGSRIVYYTNSESRAAFLTSSGKTVHVTPIEYRVEESLGEQAKHTIIFKDKEGRSFRWVFLPSGDPDESSSGAALIPQSLKAIYWVKASMAGEGTAVQIDNTTIQAKELPDMSSPPWFIAYAGNIFIDTIIGGPVSGSQTWKVKTAPSAISVGEKWVLTDDHNNSRQLKVIAKQGDEVTIQEVEANASVSAPMTLYMKETPDGLALSSISFAEGAQSLRLKFVPSLNLIQSSQAGKKSNASFQMDVGSESKFVEGILEVEQKGDLIELTVHPNSPEKAKATVLKSRITLSGSGYAIESMISISADLQGNLLTEKQ